MSTEGNSQKGRVSMMDEINPPEDTFIYLVDPGACGECPTRSCLKICPTHVFEWDGEVGMRIYFGRCLECGACSMACRRIFL
ncbi:MAG: hypothetical protein M1379_17310, partial [Firmicutes bacterium]|nr:hypothetical protein [Bacillota bacterium]